MLNRHIKLSAHHIFLVLSERGGCGMGGGGEGGIVESRIDSSGDK